MKSRSLMTAVLGMALLTAAASSQEGKPDESSRKVKELQKERLATLKDLVEVATSLRGRGFMSVDDVYDAKHQLLNAELDAAENDADRIKLLENFVDAVKELEQVADAQKKAAQATHAAILKMKSHRLEAEIALEQAKTKSSK